MSSAQFLVVSGVKRVTVVDFEPVTSLSLQIIIRSQDNEVSHLGKWLQLVAIISELVYTFGMRSRRFFLE